MGDDRVLNRASCRHTLPAYSLGIATGTLLSVCISSPPGNGG